MLFIIGALKWEIGMVAFDMEGRPCVAACATNTFFFVGFGVHEVEQCLPSSKPRISGSVTL